MYLEVVSDDHELLEICREIAAELPTTGWKLGLARNDSGTLEADLCLWDYKQGACVPENARWGVTYFVLVCSRDTVSFREAHPYAEAGIILKPVTRAVVRALMTQTTARQGSGAQLENNSIRSDRDDILQRLMQANLHLQQYEAERTNFLGRALHDFHAPLTALGGYCGLLLEEQTGSLSEFQKVVMRRMQHSVRRLSRMTKAMFQLSVGRQVLFKPALQEGDIGECAAQAVYEVQQLAEEKNLQLDLDLDAACVPLLIDSEQIEQVIINLLENACKFSPRGGLISVRGSHCFFERRAKNVQWATGSDRRQREITAPNAYRIDIADSGPGISPENLELIFEEYVGYAGGQDRSRAGLGLAICRMILNQHQGTIWAENCESGAVFSFVLPLGTANSRNGAMEIASAGATRKSLATCV